MSPAALLRYLRNDLEPWCTARKGVLSIAGDPGQVLDFLAQAPHSFRVVLSWGGDDGKDEMEESGIVDNHFEVWLIQAKGLRATPGEYLVKGEPAFLELLSDLRARVRSLGFPADESTYGRVLYKGCKPFPNPDLAFELTTVGYCLRFDLTGVVPFIGFRGVCNADGG
jgi:hypothetical protein